MLAAHHPSALTTPSTARNCALDGLVAHPEERYPAALFSRGLVSSVGACFAPDRGTGTYRSPFSPGGIPRRRRPRGSDGAQQRQFPGPGPGSVGPLGCVWLAPEVPVGEPARPDSRFQGPYVLSPRIRAAVPGGTRLSILCRHVWRRSAPPERGMSSAAANSGQTARSSFCQYSPWLWRSRYPGCRGPRRVIWSHRAASLPGWQRHRRRAVGAVRPSHWPDAERAGSAPPPVERSGRVHRWRRTITRLQA